MDVDKAALVALIYYDGHDDLRWTHLICVTDWNRLRPDASVSHTTHPHINEPEPCCWCGELTGAGIYLRADPEELHDG